MNSKWPKFANSTEHEIINQYSTAKCAVHGYRITRCPTATGTDPELLIMVPPERLVRGQSSCRPVAIESMLSPAQAVTLLYQCSSNIRKFKEAVPPEH